MDIDEVISKIDIHKVKHPPRNTWRENMHRHITKRKKRKGAHLGLVQALRKKAGK